MGLHAESVSGSALGRGEEAELSGTLSRALKLGRASKTRLQLGAEPHPPHQPSSLDAGDLQGRGVTLGKWLSADEGNSWREHTLSVLEGEASEQRLQFSGCSPWTSSR